MTKDAIARERIRHLSELMNARFEGADKATRLALDEREKAALKSERDYNERFKGQNEFRGTLSDQARTLMPRAESEKSTDVTNETLRRLENSQIASAGRGLGMSALWGYIIGAAGLAFAIYKSGAHL